MNNHPDSHPQDSGVHAEPDRMLMFQEITGSDRWVAVAMWADDESSWGRMTLTDQRVFKIEFQVGALPHDDKFLPRSAATEFKKWTTFALSHPTDTLSGDIDQLGLSDVVMWARETTRRRLRSPLISHGGPMTLPGGPNRLTLGELAFLYDAFVRINTKRPTEVLAEKTGLTVAAARNKIYRARHKGLLTPTQQGAPGGQLTLDGWAEAERGPNFPYLEPIVKDLLKEGQ